MSGVAGLFKIPELRKRILFTLGVLAVYRLGVHVPVPGVDRIALQRFFEQQQGSVFGFFNLFTGGALEQFSILALGVMPYISSSIIMQLLTVTWPYLHSLQKEGEHGRKKITQYTRYLTVVLALIQGLGITTLVQSIGGISSVLPIWGFKALTMITVCTGTMFLMWLGEQVSERGIGNGTSLIIFAGIAAGIPRAIVTTVPLVKSGEVSGFKLLVVLAVVALLFFCIIFVERANRRIPIQYAKRIVGQKVYGGQNTHLPLKVNTAGVIPPIFASSLLMFPATIVSFIPSLRDAGWANRLQPGALMYNIMFVGLIIFFCFFYTSVVFKTDDVAENLKKHGGFIPGIRPGPATVQYIEYVINRITLGGAIYISLICVMPSIFIQELGAPASFQKFLGGTSVLIMVGVALDTLAQIETFLIARNYDGFMKHARVRGRTTGRAFT